MHLSFLPQWPLEANHFILFGVILLLGLVGGEVARRTGFLPRITGFIAIGFLMGPGASGILTPQMLDQAGIFVDIALGLILFQLGYQLRFREAARDRALLLQALLEGGLSFTLIYLALAYLGVGRMHAGLAAAIGISSSPAVILLVVRELNARGAVTERALSLVAINNILAFFAFTALLPFLHYQSQAEWSTILLQPLYRLGMSLVVAYLLFQASLRIAFMIGQRESAQFALLVGVIITAIGAAKALNCSALLTLLALGLMSRNLDREGRLLEVEFGHGGQIFFVLLFVVAGARLHFGELAAAGGAALAFVAARQAGKWLGVMLLARPSGLTLGQGNLLSLTLAPMAGMAIGLAQSASNMYPEFASTLSAIVLASVAILETVGPIATEFALKKAGEVDGNRQAEH